MKKRLLISIFCFIALACVGVFACSQSTFAEAAKQMCGTFTYKIGNQGNFSKSFQVCGTVNDEDEFVNNLTLRNDDWDDSIVAVSLNSNIINFRTNSGWWSSDDFQVRAKTKLDFHNTLQSIKRGLENLGERRYQEGFKATFSDFSITTEDTTADDEDVIATNKAICENGGGTWSGDDASGYTCSNNDSLNLGPSSSGTVSTGSGNACYSNAGAMGWVLCPIIDMATGAANGMYQIIEESFLKIDTSDLFDSGNGVEQAWSAFRDIANILFIVLFLIVILSQLTGFGIDNYGIKKVLPRLIVVAILINLSYIICQLAVDVSNIVGVSLREFLTNLVPQSDLGTNAAGAQWTVTLAGGVLALGGVTAATLLGGLGAIFAILGAVITAVVAIFFLWIILVIRSAGVVLLIAIAPLAIACYLLPNTEKLSKRWLDIFKALLLLYPLSSLVIGAGALAGRILSFSNNEIMVLAAMIVQVVPFFFIPTLLRHSLSGLGNIGAKINGFGRTQGRNLSGRAQNALGNTNFAQNRRFNAVRRRTQLANNILPGSDRTRARRINTLNRIEAEELANGRALVRDDIRNGMNVRDELDRLSQQENLSARDQARIQAIASEFANTPGYSGKLTKAFTGGTAAFRTVIANHAATNGDVAGAITKKDQVAGRLISDINSGAASANVDFSGPDDMGPFLSNYNDLAHQQAALSGLSNSDLVAQGADAVQSQLNSGAIDNDRLRQLIADERLLNGADADVAAAIRGTAENRGLANHTTSEVAQRRGRMGSASPPIQSPRRPHSQRNNNTGGGFRARG